MMRKFKLLLLAAFLLLLSAAGTSALSTGLAGSSAQVGSRAQEASNHLNGVNNYAQFGPIVFNTTNPILFSYTPLPGYSASSGTITRWIDASVVSDQSSSGTRLVTIQARIPEALPAVGEDGKESAFQVAVLSFCDSGRASDCASIDLYMQRRNHLTLKKITLSYGADESQKISNGKLIDELSPGETAILDFDVENTYSQSQDVDVNDITVYAKDTGNSLDIDENEDLGILHANSDDTQAVSFDLPDDLKEGTYGLDLKALGTDDFGARHGEVYNVRVRTKKENNEITIKRIELEPDSLDVCTGNQARLIVDIENTGKRNERHASLKVSNAKLGYSSSVDELDIDSGDSRTKSFLIVIPESSLPGTYPFIIDAYYNENEDSRSDEKAALLYVKNCRIEAASVAQAGQATGIEENQSAGPSVMVVDYSNYYPQSSGPKEGSGQMQSEPSNTISLRLIALAGLAIGLIAVVLILVAIPKKR